MGQRYQIRPSNAARRRSTTCKVANMLDGFFWFFRRPSKAFATNQLPPLCPLIHFLLNERKKKGKTWWDNDESLHDTHLPRTPNPKRRICPDSLRSNTLPIWSRQEAATHLLFQYNCKECTYIEHGLVLVLWVMDVAGMRWARCDVADVQGKSSLLLVIDLAMFVNFCLSQVVLAPQER